MLKKLRLGISLLLFILITFYLLDFAGVLPAGFHWLAKIQFIPALLSLNLVILVALIVMTLLFGRIYCSSICPMGTFQDAASWISKRTAKKKKRYKFSKAKTVLRWSVLATAIISFALGYGVLFGLVDPYSAYGRMAVNILKPVYLGLNNLLELIFTGFGNYTFYKMDVFVTSFTALSVAAITLLAIGLLAWKYGRTYCNTICPVGTILGFVSKFSLFKIRIDTTKCNGCGSCAKKCKASCINSKEHTIDYSRCVDCFNCLGSCKEHALQFTPSFGRKASIHHHSNEDVADNNKRMFLSTAIATVVGVPVAMANEKINQIATGKSYARKQPISPPGSIAAEHLQHHCTSCHLCVSKCPSNILKPAFMEYGLGGIMQPTMTFEKGFCNYDCTLCSDVCPTGAIRPLTMEQKHLTQVGRVVFVKDLCVVHTEETNCGACSEHCPTQAVFMVPYKDGLTIPSINPDICVGCGGCEFICPVRPYTAIHVEGNAIHQKAKPIEKGEEKKVKIDDFGF